MGGFNPFSKKDWDKKVGDPIKKGISKAGKETKKTANKAKGELDQIDDKIVAGVKAALDAVSQEALEAGLQLAKHGISKFRRECWRLEKDKPKMVDLINQVGSKLSIGPVVLIYENFYDRARDIDHEIDKMIKSKPKVSRKTIINLVRALSPTKIDLGISVQLAALVVSSDAAGISWELNELPVDLFLEIGDNILKEMGVPK